MAEEDYKLDPNLTERELLFRACRELAQVRQQLTKVVAYMVEAESEVSEKMRRFIMYMHDLHDVSYLYESRGLPVPNHVREEMERCDDRYRQLLEEAHSQGGTFEKVRREMAKDPRNKWDHTRQLVKPNGASNDPARTSGT